MKAFGRVDKELHSFLTSSLGGGEWSRCMPFPLPAGKLLRAGWVHLTARLVVLEEKQTLAPSGIRIAILLSSGPSCTWCVRVLRSPTEAFAAAMQSWRERCEKCVCLQGDYVEK